MASEIIDLPTFNHSVSLVSSEAQLVELLKQSDGITLNLDQLIALKDCMIKVLPNIRASELAHYIEALPIWYNISIK